MVGSNDSLLILAGLGLATAVLTQSASAQTPPECVDTTWTCNTTDRLEYSNCGNVRTTDPCSLASNAARMTTGDIPVDLRYDVNGNGTVDEYDIILLKTGTPLVAFYPTLILSGHYLDGGNIYSPEIDVVNNRIYFSGWYRDSDYYHSDTEKDYPNDAIRVASLSDITNARKLIRLPPYQVGDPSIVDNKMFMTFSPDIYDLTKHKVALSTTNDNGATWSSPVYVIEHGWMPSAIRTDKLYVYYTFPDLVINQVLRAELGSLNQVLVTTPVTFDVPFYPINIDVKYYDGVYYLLGDYCQGHCSTNCGCKNEANPSNSSFYSIGLWTSTDGIHFVTYLHNPIIVPSDDNVVARTPYLIKEDNRLRIWYAQQRPEPKFWTNRLYYIERVLI